MRIRTDVHRPSAIVPADYDLVDYFGVMTVPGEYNEDGDSAIREPYGEHAMAAYDDGPRVDLWPDLERCDVCGARFVHGAVMTHRPTGLLLSIGHDCAAKYLSLRSLSRNQRADRAARRLKRRAARRKMRAMLAAVPGINAALKTDHYISKDLRASALKWGDLSEKQVALAFKIAKEESEKTPEPTAVPIPDFGDKRVVITGRVLGIKGQEGWGYNQFVWKMLVQVEAEGGAFKLWGTVPEALWVDSKPPKGKLVTFACKVKVSDTDPTFGFISRPTKASIVEEAA